MSGMELNPEWFNDQLDGMGQEVRWRRAMACPCRDTNSGQARPGCPTCQAKGQFWPDAPVECMTGVASMKVAREFAAFGTWESGDCIFTIQESSALYACGEYDRVVMWNSSEPFSAVLTRGELDALSFPVLKIDRVIYLPAPDDPPAAAKIPRVSSTGNLSWPGDFPDNGAPPDGAQYTVRGRKRQEYFVFKELPQDRAHFGGLRLPRRVQMRRFDLFGR